MSDDPRDAELSRLYREAPAAEPPRALDAAILAAAREAVQSAPRRRPWWRPWAVPMSVAATAVLTVTLTLMVQREQERSASEAAPAPSAPPAAAPAAAVPEARKARKADAPAPSPAAAEPKPAPAPAPPVTAERRESAPAADAVELRAKSVAPLRKEAAGAAVQPRTPEQWLEEIRRLKQQGKAEEAAEALAAFRQAYPDYRLPESLR